MLMGLIHSVVDGLLLIVEPQWHLLSGMPHCPDGSGRFKV
jgi:hypothetical protein